MRQSTLHPRLLEQLRACGLDPSVAPSAEGWTSLVARLSRAYPDADADADNDANRERKDLALGGGSPAAAPQDTHSRQEPECQRFRQVFELAPVGIMRVELNGSITMINPGMERMLGYTADELTTTDDIMGLVHPEDRDLAEAAQARFKAGQAPRAYTVERRLVRKNGTVVHTKAAVTVALNAEGQPLFWIVVVEDISERIRLEVELRHAQKLESVGRLAAGIAHELNTPIQFIGDNTSFLRSAHEDLIRLCDAYRRIFEELEQRVPPAQRAALAQVQEAADLEYLRAHAGPAFAATMDGVGRVATIVKAMKAFAHPDQGKKSPADINAAIENTLVVVANELKYVADVEVSYADLAPVDCCLGELNQVFLNLLVNAAHAVGDVVRRGGGGKGKIFIRTFRERDAVVVAVGDTGTGIPEEIRQKVFDPFFTTKEVGRGTGQGLAVSRSVVEKHGGTLTFETEVGRGTTFFVHLPILDSSAPPIAAVGSAAA